MRDNSRPVLIIRADAGLQMGTGHIMRCVPLAEAWRGRGGEVLFLMAESLPPLESRMVRQGIALRRIEGSPGSPEDAKETARLASEAGASWIVTDGYHFRDDYQAAVKNAGFRLLVIDDGVNSRRYHADLLLNQNPHADVLPYEKKAPGTGLLLGPRYALLRDEFSGQAAGPRSYAERAGKVLITYGGSDYPNMSLKAVELLEGLNRNDIEAVLVMGALNPHAASLKEKARNAFFSLRLEENSEKMAERMAWADMALTSAGVTSLEMACLGLPMLITTLAPNQEPVAQALEREGAAWNLGPCETFDPVVAHESLVKLMASQPLRRGMGEKARHLVDGRGARRVADAMTLKLREASAEDRRRLWEWANDPEARRVSFRPEPIDWERHVAWFEEKRKDPNYFIWIAEDWDGRAVGLARFELSGDDAVISVSLAPDLRGRGYGPVLIRIAAERLFQNTGAEKIRAFIKPGNEASCRAFERAGFAAEGRTTRSQQECDHLTLGRLEPLWQMKSKSMAAE